ncbi:MAG TPA: hypothetical protein DHI91_01275 [Candidatus Portnoybacteria bacterium]|nr:hypothetical protein [Candidatus Portnoybacteria bacterium]
MTRTIRRLIFYGFVLLFIVATPPTILYAMGYSFDWTNKKLVQTGGLYLKSVPSGAQISVNGQPQKTTPRLISRLLPHSYNISVVKDGYHSWQKNLPVEAELVSEARNIFLLPTNVSPELITQNVTSTIADFLSSPGEKTQQQRAAKIASSTAGWLLNGDNLYYLPKNNPVLYRTDLTESIKDQISQEALPLGKYQLITNDGRRFLALSTSGDLYLMNTDGVFEKIASQIEAVQLTSDNKKVLWQTANEITILWLEEFLVQPYRQAGDKETIVRYFNQKISQALFYPDNEHVAFVAGDQIKITELDGRDTRNTIDFISASNPQIYFDEPTSYFYYLTQNELFRVKLEL